MSRDCPQDAAHVTPEQTARLRTQIPQSHEDRPWGEYAIKVKGKVFVFIGESQGLGLSVKLPQSREFALEYPFCGPTRYGLGKSGWVTARFAVKEKPPLDILQAWIDESYRAIAPKKLVATLPPIRSRSPGHRG